MKKNRHCTLQKWMLLRKRPIAEACHQPGPHRASVSPDATRQTNEPRVRAPNR